MNTASRPATASPAGLSRVASKIAAEGYKAPPRIRPHKPRAAHYKPRVKALFAEQDNFPPRFSSAWTG
ncbi:MAG: hypothetical protein WBS22_18605 [Methylocystis sp.]